MIGLCVLIFACLYAVIRCWIADRQIARAMRDNFIEYQG